MKKIILLVLLLLFITPSAFAYDTYSVPSDKPMFTFRVYHNGERFPEEIEGHRIGKGDFSDNHIYTMLESAKFWSKFIKSSRNTPAILNFYPIIGLNNAFADSKIVKVLGETYYLTELNATINDKVIVDKKHDYVGGVGSDLTLMNLPFEFFSSPQPLSNSGLSNFYVLMIHELAHALGISSKSETQETKKYGSYGYIEKSLSLWDSNIRIYNTEKNTEITPPVDTPYRTSESTDKLVSDFDIGKYSPYFIGENTIKVLGNSDNYETARENIRNNVTSFGNGLLNYSIEYNNPKLGYGLPIHPGDGGDAELSHIELRNSLMSHQNYRNWLVFMEAELAALKDVGYNIDLKKHFGQSYYLNNQVIDNVNGYYERNENGTAYLIGTPSSTEYGVGLHIYGDNNQITQKADILSNGAASIGARIDGVNNKLILDENYKIQTNGTNSIGLAVTYGKNHTVNLKSNSEIRAEGINGIAASFDFGRNMMGDIIENQGSYIHQKIDHDLSEKGIIINEDVPVLEDTNGALVDNFNVSGSLVGDSAAIYISPNAYVKNINIFKDADIQGNIISEWNSVKDAANATIQTPSGKILYTNLNFGLSSDDNGDVINTPDNTFNLIYDGNIYGEDTLNMNVKGGTLTFNGNAEINSVKISENANLKGIANYDVDTFTNLGTYTTSSNSSLKANRIINNGNINIGGNYQLKNNIEGNGNINVGYDDGGQVDGKLTLDDNVKQIHGTLTINTDSELSTINKVVSVEIEKYVGMDNSKISIDLGDVLTLNLTEGHSDISQIKITSKDIADIQSGKNRFEIFDKDTLTLNGASYFYNNNRKYAITQDIDKKYLVVNDIAPALKGLNDAVTDANSANYIVSKNEVQNYDGGTVNGSYFEVTGADIDFNNHKGLIIDGTKNNETYILTGIKNVSEGGDYKAAVTVKNNGYAQINSYDKDIKISGTNSLNIDKTSFVNLIANNHDITIEGNIVGEKDNENIATLALFGSNSIYLKGVLDPLSIFVNTSNVYSSNYNDDIAWTLENGILHFSNDKYLYDSTYHDGVTHKLNKINFNGGSLNISNGSANDIKLANMVVSGNATVHLDVDLRSKKADKFIFDNSDDLIVLDKLNVVTNVINNNIAYTSKKIKIPFISEEYKNENLLNGVNVSVKSNTINTPIYKYTLNYQNEENNNIGDFVMTRGATGTYRDYNPSIFAASVGAQVGTFLNQINTYDQAFNNMDMRMLMTREQRTAMKWANKFASIDNSKGLMSYTPNQIPEQYKGVWFNPYTTFEKVGLKNGPKVENIGYGTLIGGDTEIIELKHGWDAVYSAYIGYNGSHQNYDGVSIYQNGGTFGLTGTWYKDNFFTGLTANVGANAAEASTMFGSENFTTLGTGIASKTGYNWELAKGKFIIQPSWLMSYTFVHTFDYRNAANVNIHSSPLNAIQLAPQLKFIGNLKNGWQPYAAIAMIWNIMDETKFKANNVNLPQMSVKPYVQYGLGLQKRIGERFTGYAQAMLRNGGRTGIALSLGFRWAIGK